MEEWDKEQGKSFFPIFFHKRNTNDAHMDNFSKKNEDRIPKCIRIGQTLPSLCDDLKKIFNT